MTPEEAANLLDPARLDTYRLMSRITLTVQRNSQRVTPVRTGNLRRSETTRVERAGERGVVGTNVRYARAVHRRRPFFTQGLEASRDTIADLLQEAGVEFFSGVAA